MMPARRHRLRSLLAACAVVLAAAGATLGTARASLVSAVRIVVLKGRQYQPVDLFLNRGDTIVLVNAEEDAVHHAFIEADRFTFDGGDQGPGAQATLILRETGDFVVRCGIHPKMRLTVSVR